jgi:hypothetical protein
MRKAEGLSKTLASTHDKLRDVIAKLHPEKMNFKFVLDPDV